MATLKTTVDQDGTQVTIEAEETTDGVNFKIYLSREGNISAGDIRGLFLDLDQNIDTGNILKIDTDDPFEWDKGVIESDFLSGNIQKISQIQWGENLVIDLGQGANMNGIDPSNTPPEGYLGPNIFDLGIEFGTQGAKDLITDVAFYVEGITLADLKDQYFGLRLTSTTDPEGAEGNTEGSLKLIGQFPNGDISKDWEGLSPGYWRNWSPEPPGNQVNDWNEDPLIYAKNPDRYKTFEEAFDVDPGNWLSKQISKDDITLLEALELGGDFKSGLKKNALDRQATAALLNSLEQDDDDVNGGVNYQFISEQVTRWTKLALSEDESKWSKLNEELKDYAPPGASPTSSWTTQQDTIFGLANIFEYNNNLPVNSLGVMTM